MKSALYFGLCAALLIGVPGCLKTGTKTTIKSDGTGTVTYDLSYKTEAIAAMRDRIEEMAEQADEQGRDISRFEGQEKQLDDFVASFDEGLVRKTLAKRGFTVLTAKAIEKEGWKGMTVTAKFDDVNQVVGLYRTAREEAAAAAGAGRGERGGRGGRGGRRGRGGWGRRMRGGDNSVTFIHAFETTDDATVGKAVLVAARPPRPQRQGGGEGRRGRGGRGGGGGRMGDMASDFSLDEMKMTSTITLPGKIVEVVGCKKASETAITFERANPSMGRQVSDEERAAREKGVYVTFKIPQGCKIKFTSPTPKATEKKPAAPDGEKKKRKGGLGIDGDK